MIRYEDLCRIYFHLEPERLAVHRALLQLPGKMRQAISDYLDVPKTLASFPTKVFRQPTHYVDLYSPLITQKAGREWERRGINDALLHEEDGSLGFTIGILMERDSGMPSMIYFSFGVGHVDARSVSLHLKNVGGSPIRIEDVNDEAAYTRAAEQTVERLVTAFKKGAAGRQESMGFLPA
jgi:hypothetical protein